MTNLEVYNIFDVIITAIRPAINILSIVKKNANYYTVTADYTTDLSNNDYIEIVTTNNFDGDHKVTGLSGNTFDIYKQGDFPTEIGLAYYKKPYLHLADWIEISNELLSKGKSQSLQFQKYPLILIHSDIETNSSKDPRHLAELSLTVYIITCSNINDSTLDRIGHVYSPVLYKLENALINSIRTSRYFDFSNERPLGNIPYDRKEYYFYGDKSNNKLNDAVDAIELRFKDLKVFKNNCVIPQNDILTQSSDGYVMQDADGKFLAVTYK